MNGSGKKVFFNIKTIIALILCVVGVVCAVLGILGIINNGSRKPVDAKQSIVWVQAGAYDSKGNSVSGWGTGWAIGNYGEDVQYIVTNGHVVEEAYMYPKQSDQIYGWIDVWFSQAENDSVAPEVVYYSPKEEKDICILKLPVPTNKRVPLVLRLADDVEIGETAYALGFPGNSQNRETYTTFGMDDITVTKGIVSKRSKPSWAEYDTFQMDVSIAGGNSGGPLVDEKGYAIGINTSSAVDYVDSTRIDLGMHYSIIMDELVRALDQEKIPYTLKGFNNWKMFVFFPLAFLCLAGAAVLFILNSKKAPAAQAAAPAAAAASPAAASPAAAPGGKPVLKCILGKYEGQTFDMSGGKVVIGRDTSVCNVVFPEGTPGISGNHCQVSYDPATESFLVTDNGSSYGTFLGNGRKLSPSVTERLAIGDSFYLADGANRFIVTKS